MKLKRTIGKVARLGVTGVLTTGVITAFGILSVTGAALLSPAFGVMVAAFVFGGVAEGEVYFQEITEGLKDLTLMGKRGVERLAIRSLDRQLKLTPPKQDSFLASYWQLKQLIENQREEKIKSDPLIQKIKRGINKLRGIPREETPDIQHALAKKRLAMMEQYLALRILQKQRKNSTFEDGDSKNIITALANELPNIRRKMHFLRAAIPVGLVCGAGFSFVTAGLLSTAVAGIALLSAMVWPLAIAAGIGAMFLMIHTVKEILFSDWFEAWKARIQRWFQPTDGQVTVAFVAKAAGLALVLGVVAALCVVATLGTFGTCWPAAKFGVNLIPHLINAAKWIRSAVIPIYVAGTLVFTSFKSMETLQKVDEWLEEKKKNLLEVIPYGYGKVKEALTELRKAENTLQIIDPFRFVSRLIQSTVNAVLLIGHVIASGAGTNQFPGIPPTVLTATAASNEFLQDTPFFSNGEKTLISRVVQVALSPVLLLSAVWQTLASQWNDGEAKKVLSFKSALTNAFDIQPEAVSKEPLPAVRPEWKKAEITARFDKMEKKCSELPDKAVVNQIKAEVLAMEDNGKVSVGGLFGRRDASKQIKIERLVKQYNLGR